MISSLDLFHGSFSELENSFLLAMMASYSISFIAIDMGKENHSIDSYITAIRAAPCLALRWALKPKSLYRSRAGINFYGTEKMWFGLVLGLLAIVKPSLSAH